MNSFEVNDNLEGEADWHLQLDEKTGKELDPTLVKKAQAEEMGFMGKIVVFEDSSREECLELTGRPPVTTKWVNTNKDTEEDPEIRCRLVARDFKPHGERDREDLFAAMPPLELTKDPFPEGGPEWRVQPSRRR